MQKPVTHFNNWEELFVFQQVFLKGFVNQAVLRQFILEYNTDV